MTKWVKVDDFIREILEEPWSMYWAEMKSTSEEFLDFLKDPIKSLSSDIEDVDNDFQVTSEILNHDAGLTECAVCTVGIVMPIEKRVKIMMYKHRKS